jgi:hypothetical protein
MANLRSILAAGVVAALIVPGMQAATRQVKEPKLDPRSVSAESRRVAREFWAKLPSKERTALDREVGRLEVRARRGDAVDADLAKVTARYPELARMAVALQAARWFTTASKQAFVCTGMVIVRRNGTTLCIGALKTGG